MPFPSPTPPPNNYTESFSFTDYQATYPNTPLPGNQVDNELANVATAINATEARLAVIQRSDGALQNQIVMPVNLDPSTLALMQTTWTLGGAWAASTAYTAGTLLTYEESSYLTAANYTSSTSVVTDVNNGNLIPFSDSAGLAAHINNPTGAHASSAISYSPSLWTTAAAINVRDALDALACGKGQGVATVASAATTNIAGANARYLVITGTTTITAFDSAPPLGTIVFVSFSGSLTLTNGTSLILPGGANIQTAAGDCAIFASGTSSGTASTWTCLNYTYASGIQSITLARGSIVSASTTNIGAVAAPYLQITGTTTITNFDQSGVGNTNGVAKNVEFAAALTLTSSSSLILPGGANITTAAGDCATFRCEGSGVWRCTAYLRANVAPYTITLPPITKVKTQIITTTGTYTPTTGMVFAEVEVWGGGGGGGSAGSTSGGHGAASGGGSGGYAKKLFTAAQIGSSQTVTIGAGGSGAGSSPASGNSGGTTTFGASLNLYAGGGFGGYGDGGTTGFTATIPGTGGVSANGDINGSGNTAREGVGSAATARSGWGADAVGGVGLAGAGTGTQATGSTGAAGGNASGYNAGGAGGLAANTSSPWSGGNGAPGLCVITEYISV